MISESTELRQAELTEKGIWFGYKGRISAGQYWGRAVLAWLGSFFLYASLAGKPVESSLVLFAMVLAVWISTALAWKRLQDQGRPGGMFLLVLIPIAGPVTWVVLSLLGGSPGANEYGPRTGYRYLLESDSRSETFEALH